MKVIKLIVVDDQEIFLRGLVKILSEYPFLKIIDTYQTGKGLIDSEKVNDADLILLDIQLPDIEPEDLLKQLKKKSNDVPILYLTLMRGSRMIHKLEKYGINGYLLKDAPIEILIDTIKKVAEGKTYFDEQVRNTDKLFQTNTTTIPQNKLSDLLSKREYEILLLICKELSSAEIGEKLFLSTGTVDTHRRNILVKCGVNNTVGLVKFAFQNGLLNED